MVMVALGFMLGHFVRLRVRLKGKNGAAEG